MLAVASTIAMELMVEAHAVFWLRRRVSVVVVVVVVVVVAVVVVTTLAASVVVAGTRVAVVVVAAVAVGIVVVVARSSTRLRSVLNVELLPSAVRPETDGVDVGCIVAAAIEGGSEA